MVVLFLPGHEGEAMRWWPDLLLVLWLGVCTVQDLRRRQVSNGLTIPPFAMAVMWAIWHGGDTLLRLGLVGLVVLVLFAKGGLGGADVKILLTMAVGWPVALIGALAALLIAGLVMVFRRQGRVRYAAVPVMAGGVVLSLPVQILIIQQGGF